MTAAAGAGPDPFGAGPPAGARAACFEDVLDCLTDEAKGDAGCRGNLFEPVAVEWLRRVPDGTPLGEFAGGRGDDPPIRGDISAVYSWDEFTSRFPGRVSDEDEDGGDDTDNGIDAIAEMKDGALIAIQIKAGDTVLAKRDIDSFVSCSKADPGGVRRYAYQVLIYTNPYVNKRGRNLLKSHHDMLVIPFERLDDAEPEGGWQELLDDTAAERSKVARPKPKSSEEGDGASTSAKRTPPKRRTWEQTINRPRNPKKMVAEALREHDIPNRRARPSELDDAAWLRDKYQTQGISAADIAAELGSSRQTVGKALREHGIPNRARRPSELDDAAWLRDKYQTQGISAADIAAELGSSRQTVGKALREHGIPNRARRPSELDDAAWLRDKYQTQGISAADIAAELGRSRQTVGKALREHGIPNRRARPSKLDDAAWLRDQYQTRGRRLVDVAGEAGCAPETVKEALREHGIPIRPAS